jgi:phospholipase C
LDWTFLLGRKHSVDDLLVMSVWRHALAHMTENEWLEWARVVSGDNPNLHDEAAAEKNSNALPERKSPEPFALDLIPVFDRQRFAFRFHRAGYW